MTATEAGPVRVLLVDDHPVVRAGLRLLLTAGEELAVVAEAETGREGVRLAAELRPDVAVVDLGLPDISGLDVTRAIRASLPTIRILIVTMYDEEEYVLGVLEAGADGYLLKQSPGEELRNAVLRIHAGERVLHPRALRALIARATNRAEPPPEQLSDREREVLQLLADGATSKEIAAVLGLRPKTIENHRARILDKLGAANSAAAVRAAASRGLIRPAPRVAPS
jgi:two-component system, NarL family, response regulator NreC